MCTVCSSIVLVECHFLSFFSFYVLEVDTIVVVARSCWNKDIIAAVVVFCVLSWERLFFISSEWVVEAKNKQEEKKKRNTIHTQCLRNASRWQHDNIVATFPAYSEVKMWVFSEAPYKQNLCFMLKCNSKHIFCNNALYIEVHWGIVPG